MKSLILSLLLTFFIAYSFISALDPNAQSWLSKLPLWSLYPILIVLGIAYLLALYWGVTGIIQGQRLANGIGILFSFFGIGLFWFGISMEMNKGKAAKGQFDYALTAQNMMDIDALQPILDQAHLPKGDIIMLTYWDLFKSEDKIAVCMQKGQIIGLSVKNVNLSDISCIAKLGALSSLTLDNCALTKIENLLLLKAERLNLNNNQLKNLSGLNAPKVKYLDVENNQLISLEGIENLPQAQYVNFQGNPITDFSAAKNHAFLQYLSINH